MCYRCPGIIGSSYSDLFIAIVSWLESVATARKAASTGSTRAVNYVYFSAEGARSILIFGRSQRTCLQSDKRLGSKSRWRQRHDRNRHNHSLVRSWNAAFFAGSRLR
jgi:hypothetical protein